MKSKKILIVLLIMVLLSLIFSLKINADDINLNEIKPIVDPYNNRITSMTGKILGIIQLVGSIISIVVLIIIGIKYMSLSIEDKVRYRKNMVPYIVGCFLVFTTSNIVNFIYNTSDSFLHNYEEVGTVIEVATCYREGKRLYNCRDCAKTKIEIIPRDETQHDWSVLVKPSDEDLNIYLATPANCVSKARYYHACGNYSLGCRVKNTTAGLFEAGTPDYNNHDYVATGEVVLEATCVSTGRAVLECRRDPVNHGKEIEISIDPNAHDWVNKVAAPTTDGTYFYKESNCMHGEMWYYACGRYDGGCRAKYTIDEDDSSTYVEVGNKDLTSHYFKVGVGPLVDRNAVGKNYHKADANCTNGELRYVSCMDCYLSAGYLNDTYGVKNSTIVAEDGTELKPWKALGVVDNGKFHEYCVYEFGSPNASNHMGYDIREVGVVLEAGDCKTPTKYHKFCYGCFNYIRRFKQTGNILGRANRKA